MVIAIDFDGTLVQQDGRDYEDVTTPLDLMPGAREALQSLKQAGHMLLLLSARANQALLENPDLDPLVKAGVRKIDRGRWEKSRPVQWARYAQMLRFVESDLPGIFDAIDDGKAGKPWGVDLFIDDRAMKYGWGAQSNTWPAIARAYGDLFPVRAAS